MAPAPSPSLGPYREAASAPGAWWATLYPHPKPALAQLRRILTDACGTLTPLSAYVPTWPTGRVTEITLVRDPSVTHGTPTVDAAIDATFDLAVDQGWTHGTGIRPVTGLVVGIGLREGYEPDAPVHPAGHITGRLGESGWRAQHARLVSARRIDGDVQWYSEPGLIITARRDLLPAIAAAAHALRQHRFVVTDLDQDRTYSLATTR
jgi:hypothetical protein